MRHLLLVTLAVAALGCGDNLKLAPQEDAGPPQDGGVADEGLPPPPDFTALHDYLFGGTWNTEGAVVLHYGEVVYEEYANGYTSSMRHITYSVSKSVGSALVGIAIHDGLLLKEDSICTYVTPPVGADPTLCDTTLEHLLHMSSGLQWNEGYDDPSTNVVQMLYGDQADMGLYTAMQPRIAAAGDTWLYSSGDANLLALALRMALGGQDTRAWAQEKLFDPAGMSSAIFESDRTGTLVFSSFCYMTPRDMARFGELYLEDGVLDGTRVLPEGWVTYTRTPAPPVSEPTPRVPGSAPGDTGGSYGALFWLNAASPTAPEDTWAYPEAPVDTYSAEGHWGQDIVIVPSQHLVVVRVGNDRDQIFDTGHMTGLAVTAVTGGN